MKFTDFLKQIPQIKTAELPGVNAQFKLAPRSRKKIYEAVIQKAQPKKAGVLVLFYPDAEDNVNILLTKRASYHGKHSAQISFPGGKVEEKDNSIFDTAFREANEEIGIDLKKISLIRKASDCYIPPSNFLVSPVLTFSKEVPEFVINYEVDALIGISLDDLCNDANETKTIITTSYLKNTEVPCYIFEETLVWGATAMMLSEIKELLKLSFRK